MNCYFDELLDKKLIEFWQFPGQAPEVPEESLRVPEQRRRTRRQVAGDGLQEGRVAFFRSKLNETKR